MNNLKIFNSEVFGEIRTVQLNNETYFVGKDVAEALKYNEPHKAIQVRWRRWQDKTSRHRLYW